MIALCSFANADITVKIVVPVLGSFDFIWDGKEGMGGRKWNFHPLNPDGSSSIRRASSETFCTHRKLLLAHFYALVGNVFICHSGFRYMTTFLFLIFSFLSFHPSTPASPDNLPVILHESWNDLLKKDVSAGGQVNYKALLNEKGKLQAYLNTLGKNPPQQNWERNEVIAYWINAYNAYTVKLILDHYPVQSIRDIDNGKPWDEVFIAIGGKKLSLNSIENEMLRKKFNDPRIHFAINCASKSCPKLVNEAFTGDKLDDQLNSATKNFVNDPSKNKIVAEKISVSKIFDWYKKDFSQTGTVIDFLNQYSSIKIQPTATISFLDYDWSLNE